MAEYIEKEMALKLLTDRMDAYGTFSVERSIYMTARQKIKNIPAADVASVVHGKNITDMHPVDEFICSECGINLTEFCGYVPEEDIMYEYKFKYCPECGAKMDLEE